MEENNEQDNFKQNDDDHLLKAVVDMIGMLVCPNNKSSLFFLVKNHWLMIFWHQLKNPKVMDNTSSHVLTSQKKSLPVATLALVKPSIDLIDYNSTIGTNDDVDKAEVTMILVDIKRCYDVC